MWQSLSIEKNKIISGELGDMEFFQTSCAYWPADLLSQLVIFFGLLYIYQSNKWKQL